MGEGSDEEVKPTAGEAGEAGEAQIHPIFRRSAEAVKGASEVFPPTGSEERKAADFLLSQFGIDNPEELRTLPFGDREALLDKIKDPQLRAEVEARFGEIKPGETHELSHDERKRTKEEKPEKEADSERVHRLAEQIAERNLNVADSALKDHVSGLLVKFITGDREFAKGMAEISHLLKTSILKTMLRTLCFTDAAFEAKDHKEFQSISREAVKLFDERWPEKERKAEEDFRTHLEKNIEA